MRQRESSFLGRTGQSVYFGVGSFGSSKSLAGNCYRLSLVGVNRDFIVQVVNYGGDVAAPNFDLQMGGGGRGLFDSCTRDGSKTAFQFDATVAQWGAQYGGCNTNVSCCSTLPPYPYCATANTPADNMQELCRRSFTMNLRDHPIISQSCQVACPAELYQATGLRRADEPTNSFSCTGGNYYISGGHFTKMMDCQKPAYGWAGNVQGRTYPGFQQVVPCRRDGYTRVNA